MGNKKSKIIQLPLSPENYIRTRVRNLPIGDCYIDKDWEEVKSANILVTRRHSNGNLTIGYYFVDMLLEGLKETDFYFNIDPVLFNNLLNPLDEDEKIDYLKIDYPLIHNIIYGAIDFAWEYDFNPPKEFNLTQNILAEDNDEIEIIDVEFGEDGIPVVLVSKELNQKANIAKLEKTAGKGNFFVYHVKEDGTAYREDFDDNSEDIEYIETSIEDWDETDMADFISGKKKINFESSAKVILSLYIESLNKKDKKEIDNILDNFDKWKIIDDFDDSVNIANAEVELWDILSDKTNDAPSLELLDEINEAIEQFPSSYYFKSLKGMCLEKLCMFKEEKKLALELFESYPGNVTAFCNFIKFSDDKEVIDSFLKDFSNIHNLFPEKEYFTVTEVVHFINVMVKYYLDKKDYNKAVGYAVIFLDFELRGELKKIAEITFFMLFLQIEDKIKEALKFKKIK